MLGGDIDTHIRSWAFLLGVLFAGAVSGGIIWLFASRRLTTMQGSLGAMKVTLSDTHQQVKEVNAAVNHVGPGEAPLIQRVRTLEADSAWTREALSAIAAQLGAPLPPHPKETP